jgi:hypothetical protein
LIAGVARVRQRRSERSEQLTLLGGRFAKRVFREAPTMATVFCCEPLFQFVDSFFELLFSSFLAGNVSVRFENPLLTAFGIAKDGPAGHDGDAKAILAGVD